MLVPFPIAFLSTALLTDIAFWLTQDFFWARASLWLVGAGFVAGSAAATAGILDFMALAGARNSRAGHIHAAGNTLVLMLAFVSWLVRLQDVGGAVLPWGLSLSVLTVLILMVTGWMGGEMVYRRGVGVAGGGRPPPG
ncbi:DUF2231 domain-containing protein [Ectothiorhodospiraceae bacterium 2226]|nr:DUF2231 domain-containing protein [Ectothiorhodospiraceae bacterium 2226]